MRQYLGDIQPRYVLTTLDQRAVSAHHQPLFPVTRREFPDQEFGLPFAATEPVRQVDMANAVFA
jgi:hypothetical protein